jgi:hypothetical protein
MPSHPKAADLPALLAALCDSGVEFIIVGGVAAVLQGVPITTNDLDIVHRRTPENVVRLLELLLKLDATMRYDMARRGLRPTAEMPPQPRWRLQHSLRCAVRGCVLSRSRATKTCLIVYRDGQIVRIPPEELPDE